MQVLNKPEKENMDKEIPAVAKNKNAVTSTGPEKKINPASVRNPDQQKILQPETKIRMTNDCRREP